jgi:hypothetical protein
MDYFKHQKAKRSLKALEAKMGNPKWVLTRQIRWNETTDRHEIVIYVDSEDQSFQKPYVEPGSRFMELPDKESPQWVLLTYFYGFNVSVKFMKQV